MEAQTHLILRNLQHWLETGSRLIILATIAIFIFSNQIRAQELAASIGEIAELSGSAALSRSQEDITASLGLPIQQFDEAITANGRLSLEFLDSSKVFLTEHSELLIDEYIFDPDPSKAKMALTFALGTTRFVTGNLQKIDKQRISIKTPTADVFINGTEFSITVSETGSSLIILLPDSLGLSSGEIEVVTAAGSVLLNKPFQATTVDVPENAPTKPVILDLDLNLINNIMLITPPKPEEVATEENVIQTADYLAFDDLDIDFLDEDLLAEDEDFEFTELEINYLDVNFLEDLLNILDELDVQEEDALAADGMSSQIAGTKLGQDLETGIITFFTGEILTLQRLNNQKARVDIDGTGKYEVIFIQDGVSRVVQINGGGGSTITVRQSG